MGVRTGLEKEFIYLFWFTIDFEGKDGCSYRFRELEIGQVTIVLRSWYNLTSLCVS